MYDGYTRISIIYIKLYVQCTVRYRTGTACPVDSDVVRSDIKAFECIQFTAATQLGRRNRCVCLKTLLLFDFKRLPYEV